MSLREVAEKGDRIETLTALRDYLANALDECQSDRDRASISGRLMDCLDKLDGILPVEMETPAERIKRRAEDRRAAAQEATEGAVH